MPLLAVRMHVHEFRLLAEQPHRRRVRAHHQNHRYVEGDQRTEHEKRPIVYGACVRERHYVALVEQR